MSGQPACTQTPLYQAHCSKEQLLHGAAAEAACLNLRMRRMLTLGMLAMKTLASEMPTMTASDTSAVLWM